MKLFTFKCSFISLLITQHCDIVLVCKRGPLQAEREARFMYQCMYLVKPDKSEKVGQRQEGRSLSSPKTSENNQALEDSLKWCCLCLAAQLGTLWSLWSKAIFLVPNNKGKQERRAIWGFQVECFIQRPSDRCSLGNETIRSSLGHIWHPHVQ